MLTCPGLEGARAMRIGRMCVWDGTYTAPEEEREALDQVPGWRDDSPPLSLSRTPLRLYDRVRPVQREQRAA